MSSTLETTSSSCGELVLEQITKDAHNTNSDDLEESKTQRKGSTSKDENETKKSHGFLSKVDRYFGVTHRGSSFKKEILGGLAMFLASLYILQVQPKILGLADVPTKGTMQSTALLSGLGTISMGFFSHMPIMVSTGMGENYFFSNLVKKNNYSWQTAGSIVFVQGIIVVIISWRLLRAKFYSSIPPMFRIGIIFGISLFIGTLGVKSMINNPETEKPGLHFGLLLAILCLVSIVSFALRGKIYVFVVAPLVTAAISQAIKALMKDFEMPGWGVSGLELTAFKINFDWHTNVLWVIPVMTINQLFDSVCAVLAIVQIAYLDNITFNETEFCDFVVKSKRSKILHVITIMGVWSSISGLFSNSQIVPFIESIIAVIVGARTGLAAVITGLCFLLSMAIYPVLSLIPLESITPLMVYPTAIVFKIVKHLDFDDLNTIIPIVVVSITIPLMSSIFMGISLGYSTLILLWLIAPGKKYKDITLPMFFVFVLVIIGLVFGLLE
ncbi:xanthine/uracil permease [Anaeramoeba flamelloides]|uniref:Xanthine/uracil permease n=1 Tax=Anaeramoeba flamelloides TaxID=1746091 RepID=A0AAV7YAR5_9EUKA|nr:xanthine/uracil permease [Anaeramoeba flamelloides]